MLSFILRGRQRFRVLCVLVLIGEAYGIDPLAHPNSMIRNPTRRLNSAAVTDLATQIGEHINMVRCDLLKAGIGCQTPGIQQAWTGVAKKIFKTAGNLPSTSVNTICIGRFCDRNSYQRGGVDHELCAHQGSTPLRTSLTTRIRQSACCHKFSELSGTPQKC